MRVALNTFQNRASEMKRIEKGAKLAASRCRARAEQVQSVIDSTKEYEQADMRLHSLRIMMGKEEPKKGDMVVGALDVRLYGATVKRNLKIGELVTLWDRCPLCPTPPPSPVHLEIHPCRTLSPPAHVLLSHMNGTLPGSARRTPSPYPSPYPFPHPRDKNGTIDSDEFKKNVKAMVSSAVDNEIDELFKRFDADGGGFIDLDEIGKALTLMQKGAFKADEEERELMSKVKELKKEALAQQHAVLEAARKDEIAEIERDRAEAEAKENEAKAKAEAAEARKEAREAKQAKKAQEKAAFDARVAAKRQSGAEITPRDAGEKLW